MSQLDERRPVEGEEIRQSKLLTLLAGALLLVGLTICGYSSLAEPRKPDEAGSIPMRWILGPAGAIMLAVGLIQLVRVWRRNQRLRLGSDRLQLIEREATVVGEIPYDNIVEIVLRRTRKNTYLLMLRLDDPGRSDTDWPQPAGFADFLRQREGCDVLICHQTGFALSAPVIRDKLLERWQKFKAAPATSPSAP